jgi:hypothetical protein
MNATRRWLRAVIAARSPVGIGVAAVAADHEVAVALDDPVLANAVLGILSLRALAKCKTDNGGEAERG